MAQLLLTGATGLLGMALARALVEAGHPLRALVRKDSNPAASAELSAIATLYRGDLNDPESLLAAMEGVDTVIHAAAMVSYQAGDRDELLLVNGEGTANVVNMALEAGVRRLIHLSSVAALDREDGGKVTGLANRWPSERPRTAYAESKFAAEREVWRGQAEGLEVAVLYPSIILGPGNWAGQNTPALWRMAAAERRFYPLGTAGFVDLRDVVDAALFVLERNVDGDRFLLNGGNLSWRDLQEKIARSIGAKPPSLGLAPWQSALLWPVEGLRAKLTGQRPLITRESHRNVQARYQYDGSAYVEASGRPYRPLDETIAAIGKAFLADQAATPGAVRSRPSGG